MKIRNGFVSNSSTSSFLIYGVCIEDGEMEDLLGITDEVRESEDYDLWEIIETTFDGAGMEYHYPDGYDEWYIGNCWSLVGDDETGKQFKDKIEAKLKSILGDKIECSTYAESYYN